MIIGVKVLTENGQAFYQLFFYPLRRYSQLGGNLLVGFVLVIKLFKDVTCARIHGLERLFNLHYALLLAFPLLVIIVGDLQSGGSIDICSLDIVGCRGVKTLVTDAQHNIMCKLFGIDIVPFLPDDKKNVVNDVFHRILIAHDGKGVIVESGILFSKYSL